MNRPSFHGVNDDIIVEVGIFVELCLVSERIYHFLVLLERKRERVGNEDFCILLEQQFKV